MFIYARKTSDTTKLAIISVKSNLQSKKLYNYDSMGCIYYFSKQCLPLGCCSFRKYFLILHYHWGNSLMTYFTKVFSLLSLIENVEVFNARGLNEQHSPLV